MKKWYSLAIAIGWLLVSTLTTSAQTDLRTVVLKQAKLTSSVGMVTKDVADHALRIASYILTSKAFQDSLKQRSYDYRNVCQGCDSNRATAQPDLPGGQVMDSLLRKPTAFLALTVQLYGKKPRKGECYGLGSTCPNTNSILSFYENILCDMGDDFPFEYAYAVHLCHEYTHNVGYCHTDNSQERDVAESVGWIAYAFMKKWYDGGTRIP